MALRNFSSAPDEKSYWKTAPFNYYGDFQRVAVAISDVAEIKFEN